MSDAGKANRRSEAHALKILCGIVRARALEVATLPGVKGTSEGVMWESLALAARTAERRAQAVREELGRE